MKLEWFSPLPSCKSGIAVYTWDIAEVFGRHADIRYWNFWGDEGRGLAPKFVVSDWNDRESRSTFNDGGIPIYHFGNNGAFHWPMWNLIEERPGIAVIHDGALLHLAVHMLVHVAKNRIQFVRTMQHYYGIAGVEAARGIIAGTIDSFDIAPRFPWTEYVLDRASAAVVHTRKLFDFISNNHKLPVLFAPLPAGAGLLEIARQKRVRLKFHDPLRVIVFGHLVPNRRLPNILRAIAESTYRNRIRLTIAGEISDRSRIASEVELLELQPQVSLEGYVSESRLHALLADADVAINLRHPTMGEASHSQLHLWAHGLPTLVTKAGWYAEQPPGTVVTAEPCREVDDIKGFLAHAFTQPESLIALGKKGCDWLIANHTPSSYVDEFVKFAEKIGSVPSWTLARSFSERAGAAISSLRLDAAQVTHASSLVRAIKSLSGLHS
ncbi:MAG: glycosyltransferase [Dongiaceae bacterium]